MITNKEQGYAFFKFLCNATGIDCEALILAERNEPLIISVMLWKPELFDIYWLTMAGEAVICPLLGRLVFFYMYITTTLRFY